MNNRLLFLLCFVIYNLVFIKTAFCDTEKTISFFVDGLKRSYELYVPEIKENLPLVIILHGGGSNGKRMSLYTNFNELAKKEHFITVFPNAYGKNWNDGRKILASEINDVKFIAQIIDQVSNLFKIDKKKVYVTGISNGALMSFKLAYGLPEKITAIASVEGSLSEELAKEELKAKIPLLMMNGTKDPIVKWEGGDIIYLFEKRGKILSVEETFAFWSKNNECTLASTWLSLPDIKDDGTSIFKLENKSCYLNKKVVLYKIENGGHTWAGAFEYNYFQAFLVGKTSYDLKATQVIWDFFKQF